MTARSAAGAGEGTGPQGLIEVGNSEAPQGNGETGPRQEDRWNAHALSAQLAGKAESLCRELLPAGVKAGAEWRCASIQGQAGNSLGVHLNGDKAGVWSDFATGESGDALGLVKAALRYDTRQAMDWARSWLGLDSGPAAKRRPADPRGDRGRENFQPDRAPTQDAALEIWRASQPALGTPVETYLASRGITIPVPPSIRYHPALKHGPTGLYFEAMVAAIQGPDGRITGIHRTFLLAGGRGKARISKPKMMLGRCAGGTVRFARVATELILGEGIESTLSVVQDTGKPAWATLSTSGLRAVQLPPEAETVIIAADGDEPGETAAKEAARRFMAEGRSVKIARPPVGMDFNDLLRLPKDVTCISDRRRRGRADG